MIERTAFFLSDRTGITAETLGNSLLTQFDGIHWHKVSIPFVDSLARADEVAMKIAKAAEQDGHRPLIFSTFINKEIREHVAACSQCIVYDFFDTFIESMEKELHMKSAHAIGRSHSMLDDKAYSKRIAAINYTLNNDDGITLKNFDQADIILVGVSRSGKTPTCLYMAMQYGVAAANYPLTEEDMDKLALPQGLTPFKEKIFGLTLSVENLHRIRSERRPNSRYASIQQCKKELQWQENLYKMLDIPYIDTTTISIEEITTVILSRKKIKKRLY